MKIEISEVFVTHIDDITTQSHCTPIGIAALQQRPTEVTRNIKRGLLSRLLGLIKVR